MDEYVFLVMAKLKADRLKLEREQRELLSVGLTSERVDTSHTRELRAAGGFFTQLEWREQS